MLHRGNRLQCGSYQYTAVHYAAAGHERGLSCNRRQVSCSMRQQRSLTAGQPQQVYGEQLHWGVGDQPPPPPPRGPQHAGQYGGFEQQQVQGPCWLSCPLVALQSLVEADKEYILDPPPKTNNNSTMVVRLRLDQVRMQPGRQVMQTRKDILAMLFRVSVQHPNDTLTWAALHQHSKDLSYVDIAVQPTDAARQAARAVVAAGAVTVGGFAIPAAWARRVAPPASCIVVTLHQLPVEFVRKGCMRKLLDAAQQEATVLYEFLGGSDLMGDAELSCPAADTVVAWVAPPADDPLLTRLPSTFAVPGRPAVKIQVMGRPSMAPALWPELTQRSIQAREQARAGAQLGEGIPQEQQLQQQQWQQEGHREHPQGPWLGPQLPHSLDEDTQPPSHTGDLGSDLQLPDSLEDNSHGPFAAADTDMEEVGPQPPPPVRLLGQQGQPRGQQQFMQRPGGSLRDSQAGHQQQQLQQPGGLLQASWESPRQHQHSQQQLQHSHAARQQQMQRPRGLLQGSQARGQEVEMGEAEGSDEGPSTPIWVQEQVELMLQDAAQLAEETKAGILSATARAALQRQFPRDFGSRLQAQCSPTQTQVRNWIRQQLGIPDTAYGSDTDGEREEQPTGQQQHQQGQQRGKQSGARQRQQKQQQQRLRRSSRSNLGQMGDGYAAVHGTTMGCARGSTASSRQPGGKGGRGGTASQPDTQHLPPTPAAAPPPRSRRGGGRET